MFIFWPSWSSAISNTPRSANVSKNTRESRTGRGDIVKDDSGYRAVFTKQGASPSQVAAAKFLDTISRLSGMAGEANNAVSCFSQVHMSAWCYDMAGHAEKCVERSWKKRISIKAGGNTVHG